MYGANLFGGNEYASKKLYASASAAVIRLGMVILTGLYGAAHVLRLKSAIIIRNRGLDRGRAQGRGVDYIQVNAAMYGFSLNWKPEPMA